jgi:hypothetical protein
VASSGRAKEALLVFFFHAGFLLCLFFDPKNRAIFSSETSVNFRWTTWRHIPEDSTLYRRKYLDDDSFLGYFSTEGMS